VTLQFELFAASPTTPERLWDVVGDLSRLPEWTDADAGGGVDDGVGVGDTFTTVDGDRQLVWTVITAEPRLLEARADTASGRVGVGLRVAADPGGSRLVVAGMLKPSVNRLRARLIELPRLRRRLDAWSTRAVRVAAREPGP
jgi:hypothetical protein